MTFTLTIELGNGKNAKMRTPRHLADALSDAARNVLQQSSPHTGRDIDVPFGRVILDGNGNSVGQWEVK